MKAKYFPNSSFLKEENPRFGLAFWNGIQCTRDFLNNHKRWIIGNGRKVKFWKDMWLLLQPFKNHEEFSGLKRKLTLKYGNLVHIYISHEEGLSSKHLTLEKVSESQKKVLYSLNLMLRVYNLFSKNEDSFVWGSDK